jgi:uncharacterized protein (TIGR02145 family)
MKPNLLLLLSCLLLVAACKKDGKKEPVTSEITISGTVYPTIKIGQQEWTAVNYDGPGGVAGHFYAPNPNYKKFYTQADLAGLKLPAGWRIPTVADFNKLMSNFTTQKDTDGNFVVDYDKTLALKSTSEWEISYPSDKQGTNTSGFNAYPAGYYAYPYNETPGNFAVFLTATPLPPAKVTVHATYYSFIITRLYPNFSSDDYTRCSSCFLDREHNTDAPKSVRFVRDN